MKIISLWSGPRNVSTALMYSFAEREDTKVVDEPLYAHYLRLTDADHPGKDLMLAEMENDGNKVIIDLLNHTTERPILFLKNMAHHYLALDNYFLENFYHIFLVRDPREMLQSLVKQIPNPELRDTGLKKQVELYQELEKLGKTPIIIESKYLLKKPEFVLKKVCNYLNITFDEAMLSWPPGAIDEDGVWAKFWYHNVHQSTGFAKYRKKNTTFPKKLIPLLEESKPYYQFLHQRAIKIS